MVLLGLPICGNLVELLKRTAWTDRACRHVVASNRSIPSVHIYANVLSLALFAVSYTYAEEIGTLT